MAWCHAMSVSLSISIKTNRMQAVYRFTFMRAMNAKYEHRIISETHFRCRWFTAYCFLFKVLMSADLHMETRDLCEANTTCDSKKHVGTNKQRRSTINKLQENKATHPVRLRLVFKIQPHFSDSHFAWKWLPDDNRKWLPTWS